MPKLTSHQLAQARELRRESTLAEIAAWYCLRSLRPQGFTFRRQHPIGRLTVDFCCLRRSAVIELDGSVHAQPSRAARDRRRDAYLARLGYSVKRLPNGMALEVPELFTSKVLDFVSRLPLHGASRRSPLTRR